jgi:hypothetical protein
MEAGSVSDPETGATSDSGSCAELLFIGVKVPSKKSKTQETFIAGSHGPEQFLLTIAEKGLMEASRSSAAGTSAIIEDGKAYVVSISWSGGDYAESPDDPPPRDWQVVADLSNGEKFCDEDGDFDPDKAQLPTSVWQLAFGKIIAPIPSESQETADAASVHMRSAPRVAGA